MNPIHVFKLLSVAKGCSFDLRIFHCTLFTLEKVKIMYFAVKCVFFESALRQKIMKSARFHNLNEINFMIVLYF